MVFPRRKKKLIKRIANKHGYTILLLVSEEKCPRFCFCRRPLLFFGHFLKRQRDRFISFHHFFAKFHQRLPTLTCATNPTNNCSLKRGLCLWLDPSLQQWELMELEIKPDTLRYENRDTFTSRSWHSEACFTVKTLKQHLPANSEMVSLQTELKPSAAWRERNEAKSNPVSSALSLDCHQQRPRSPARPDTRHTYTPCDAGTVFLCLLVCSGRKVWNALL